MTHTDVGDLTGVKVRFVRGDGLLVAIASQHEVKVKYVTFEFTERQSG